MVGCLELSQLEARLMVDYQWMVLVLQFQLLAEEAFIGEGFDRKGENRVRQIISAGSWTDGYLPVDGTGTVVLFNG